MRLVQSTRNRSFATSIPPSSLQALQAGTLRTRYKGLRLCKNPFDIVLYMQLIEGLKPKTIIEIGSSEGGSAVWFNDLCKALGLDTTIISLDLVCPDLGPIEKIQFLNADADDPETTFPTDLLKRLPHPWLVVEDSAHTYSSVSRVLHYFDSLVRPGDYVVVEDGIVADLEGALYAAFNDGPNRAVAEFLERKPIRYRIDQNLCDFFGYNATYCPNAWLEVCQEDDSFGVGSSISQSKATVVGHRT